MGNANLLVVMAGAPGSGKSTVAMELSDRYGLEVVSTDAIRGELFGDEGEQGGGALVFSTAYARAAQALSDPLCPGVIFDATNCRRRARRDVLAELDGLYGTAICVVADVPLDTCLLRNATRDRFVPEDVVERFWRNLDANYPGTDEGFDSVVGADFADEALYGLLR